MSNSNIRARLLIDGQPVTPKILREIAHLAGFDLDEVLKNDMKTENTFWSNVLRQMGLVERVYAAQAIMNSVPDPVAVESFLKEIQHPSRTERGMIFLIWLNLA